MTRKEYAAAYYLRTKESRKEKRRAYAKKFYAKNIEKERQRRRVRYLKNTEKEHEISRVNQIKARNYNKIHNPESYILKRTKQSARNRKLEFNLTIEDIVIPEVCPILGIPLVMSLGRATQATPTVDRIDNSKGYIKGNIGIISRHANSCKCNMTIDDVRNLLKYMEQSN